MVNVLFFGALAEIAGCSQIKVEHVDNTDLLHEYLVKRYPLLANRKFAVALNKTVVQQSAIIPENSEVALLPPFSGG